MNFSKKDIFYMVVCLLLILGAIGAVFYAIISAPTYNYHVKYQTPEGWREVTVSQYEIRHGRSYVTVNINGESVTLYGNIIVTRVEVENK